MRQIYDRVLVARALETDIAGEVPETPRYPGNTITNFRLLE